MATPRQRQAARKNVKKAVRRGKQKVALRKITRSAKRVRTVVGRQLEKLGRKLKVSRLA